MFADDKTSIIKAKTQDKLSQKIKDNINQISNWFEANGLHINKTKSNILNFHTAQKPTCNLNIVMNNGDQISHKSKIVFLGTIIQDDLKWVNHINDLEKRLNKALFAVRTITKKAGLEAGLIVYHGCFMSILRYAIVCWGSTNLDTIFILQKRAVRALTNSHPRAHCHEIFKQLKLLTVPAVYILELAIQVWRNRENIMAKNWNHTYCTRGKKNFQYPKHRLTLTERSSTYMGIKIFNALSYELKEEKCLIKFKRKLKAKLIENCPYTLKEFLK